MGGEYSKETCPTSTKVFDDCVNGLPSLDGKVVAITGCTTGMGFHLAEAAVKKGASTVLMLNRPSERATSAEKKIQDIVASTGNKVEVQSVDCDLQSLASVKECAQKVSAIAAERGGLDVLANNAGIMAMPDKRTADGFEVQMQTNQISHVVLLKAVMHQLEKAAAGRGEARVVFHSSSARDLPAKDLKEEHFAKCEAGSLGGDTGPFAEMTGWSAGGPWNRYHQTKLANSAFAMALHDELRERKSAIKAMAVDPGFAASELQVTSTQSGLMPHWAAKLTMGRAQSAQDGTAPLAMACFSPEADSGDFYAPADGMTGAAVKTISKGVPVKAGTEKLSTNEANKCMAWKKSLEAADIASLFSE
mmetsp:Transcript_104258/g.290417  ORF Transcript_104258/g.290417 Transcript_104258/m.290417 type:complete len:362 (-) Transcript_104258:154-1239(-)